MDVVIYESGRALKLRLKFAHFILCTPGTPSGRATGTWLGKKWTWPGVLERQAFRLLHLRQLLHRGEHCFRHRLIDLDKADGVLALGQAAQMEGRDIDAGIAEQHAERPDEAG